MTVNNQTFMKLADEAANKAFEMISQIANFRLEFLANEFRSKFPKRSLTIIFANGTECVSVDGYDLGIYGESSRMTWERSWADDRVEDQFGFIGQAVRDVWDITDHYRRGCPDDLEVLPDDRELQGGPDAESTEYVTTIEKRVGSNIQPVPRYPTYDCPRPRSPGDSVHIQ